MLGCCCGMKDTIPPLPTWCSFASPTPMDGAVLAVKLKPGFGLYFPTKTPARCTKLPLRSRQPSAGLSLHRGAWWILLPTGSERCPMENSPPLKVVAMTACHCGVLKQRYSLLFVRVAVDEIFVELIIVVVVEVCVVVVYGNKLCFPIFDMINS